MLGLIIYVPFLERTFGTSPTLGDWLLVNIIAAAFAPCWNLQNGWSGADGSAGCVEAPTPQGGGLPALPCTMCSALLQGVTHRKTRLSD